MSLRATVINLEDAEDEIEDIQVRPSSSPRRRPPSSRSRSLTPSPLAQSEISILSSLDSPFVTKYEGSWLRGHELWIVMEYLSGGSCGDLLKPGTFKEDYIAIVCRELLRGLEYLHEEGKLHRDIKGASKRSSRARRLACRRETDTLCPALVRRTAANVLLSASGDGASHRPPIRCRRPLH